MALDLSAAWLGVLTDTPGTPLQSDLRKGLHLRWASSRSRGFPWHGYFVFARKPKPPKEVCARDGWSKLPSGTVAELSLDTQAGVWTSDRRIAITRDFTVEGELDLAGRRGLACRLHAEVTARSVHATVGFRKPAAPAEIGEVTLSLYAGPHHIGTEKIVGKEGERVEVEVAVPHITEVRFTGANAALLELCAMPEVVDLGADWVPLEGYEGPIPLPVFHPDYPCPGAPQSRIEAENLALARIRYGSEAPWSGAAFNDLHELLVALVVGGPAGPPMVDRTFDATHDGAHVVGLRPLDLVTMGALHPAVAQMLGLYALDAGRQPDEEVEYLILADYDGTLGGTPQRALEWLVANPTLPGVDGALLVDAAYVQSQPLRAPTAVRAFALPGLVAPAPDASLEVSDGLVGLNWHLDLSTTGTLAFGSAVTYHIWRSDLGANPGTVAPSVGDYGVIDKTAMAVADPLGPPAPRPPGWPPDRLFLIDRRLKEGWYGYRVSGVDIFGRHSALSEPATWWQWVPAPAPVPWYYQPPFDARSIHDFAVHILDKVPPPPPELLAATALDPADPAVVRDAAYHAWRASLPAAVRDALVGLRVRWRWTSAHQRVAPDTAEFRIYYQPGRFNVEPCAIVAVSAVAPGQSAVTTDLTASVAAGDYAGTLLRTGAGGFRVVGSEAASPATPLVLRVANLGPQHDRAPTLGTATINVAGVAGHPHRVDPGDRTSWAARLGAVDVAARIDEDVIALETPAGTVRGSAGTLSGSSFLLDGAPLLTAVQPGLHALAVLTPAGEVASIHDIVAVAPLEVRVVLAPPPPPGPPRPWVIGLRRWTYERFFPGPGEPAVSIAPSPSLSEPIAWAQVGVSAADWRTHSADDPRWQPPRLGNEGAVAGPTPVYAVLRTSPPAPEVVVDSDALRASAADYHGRSQFTFRWPPLPHLAVHVVRALDQSVFVADRALRPRPPLSPTDPVFPDPALEPSWTPARMQLVAAELDGLNANSTDAAYQALSNDAVRILASLPGVESAFVQRTATPLNPAAPATTNRRGPGDPDGVVIDPGLRVFIDTLDGRTRSRYLYRAVYVDGAHNRGAASRATPPVVLPQITPPPPPVIAEARAGGAAGPLDGAITLRWRTCRDPAVVGYRVFRAISGAAARDLRDMVEVATIAVAADPGSRPRHTPWSDLGLAEATYHYRLAALDRDGNTSEPSAAIAVRCLADVRPAPPVWQASSVDSAGAASLQWTSIPADLAVLVERSAVSPVAWQRLGTWLARGTSTYIDQDRSPGQSFVYRLRVLDTSGRQNRDFATVVV